MDGGGARLTTGGQNHDVVAATIDRSLSCANNPLVRAAQAEFDSTAVSIGPSPW